MTFLDFLSGSIQGVRKNGRRRSNPGHESPKDMRVELPSRITSWRVLEVPRDTTGSHSRVESVAQPLHHLAGAPSRSSRLPASPAPPARALRRVRIARAFSSQVAVSHVEGEDLMAKNCKQRALAVPDLYTNRCMADDTKPDQGKAD